MKKKSKATYFITGIIFLSIVIISIITYISENVDVKVFFRYFLSSIVFLISFYTIDPLNPIHKVKLKNNKLLFYTAILMYFLSNIAWTIDYKEFVTSLISIFSNLTLFLFAFNIVFRTSESEDNEKDKKIIEEKLDGNGSSDNK